VFFRAKRGAVKARAELRRTTRKFVARPIFILFLPIVATALSSSFSYNSRRN
jgi:hypothetical protein